MRILCERLKGIVEVDVLFFSPLYDFKTSFLSISQLLLVVPLCDSFPPICSLETDLLDFHKRDASCYEEILMDLKLQGFFKVLLS